MEKEKPLTKKESVVKKIKQANGAPYFSLKIKSKKTTNSKYPKK
jgi:ribosomal protein L39E